MCPWFLLCCNLEWRSFFVVVIFLMSRLLYFVVLFLCVFYVESYLAKLDVLCVYAPVMCSCLSYVVACCIHDP